MYATGTTGRLIEEVTNLSVKKYLPGYLGGVEQMKADIESNLIDLVIYLNDPLSGNQRDVKINSVLQQCDVHNIPLATNLATAELLILALTEATWTGAKCTNRPARQEGTDGNSSAGALYLR